MLPITDGPELEGATDCLAQLLDRRQPFYRRNAVPGAAGTTAISGVEGAELLSVLSEEDWRAAVGFADWVGGVCVVERGRGVWDMLDDEQIAPLYVLLQSIVLM